MEVKTLVKTGFIFKRVPWLRTVVRQVNYKLVLLGSEKVGNRSFGCIQSPTRPGTRYPLLHYGNFYSRFSPFPSKRMQFILSYKKSFIHLFKPRHTSFLDCLQKIIRSQKKIIIQIVNKCSILIFPSLIYVLPAFL